MLKVKISQCKSVAGNFFMYEVHNSIETILQDIIDDYGQGLEIATQQINALLKRKNIINLYY